MTRIYLDTNVFFKHGFFRSKGAKAIFTACHLSGFQVIIPETVVDEVIGNYEKQLLKAHDGLEAAGSTLGKLADRETVIFDVNDAISKFKNDFTEMIKEKGIQILPYPPFTSQDLVKEAYKGRRPFDEKGNGYKDFLIWEAIKTDMLEHPKGTPLIFVTENTNDFGIKKGQSDSQGRFVLHSDLMLQIDEIKNDLKCYTHLTKVLEQLILPALDGLTIENVDHLSDHVESFVESMVSEHLSFRTMYGLEGLAFSNDVTITGYGEISDLEVNVYKFEDEHMVRITGSSECMFQGYMEKWEYYSEYGESTLSASQWNDHVLEVEDEANVEFEILAIYDPDKGKFNGQAFQVTNEIDPDWYQ